MRSIFLPFALFVLLTGCHHQKNTKVFPQINPLTIKKIILSTGGGGLGGHSSVTAEVIYEHKQWNTYLTDVNSVISFRQEVKPEFIHQYIGTINNDIVNVFLNSIKTIKTQLDLAVFNVSVASLKGELQFNPAAPRLENIITDGDVKKILAASANLYGMDTYTFGTIQIIKSNGDTTKLECYDPKMSMLPWTINKRETYDINIMRFFSKAMGKQHYPTEDWMNPNDGIRRVWEQLDNGDRYPLTLHNYRWKYGYPKNQKLLSDNFTWKGVDIRGILGTCYLHNKDLPANVSINTAVDITDLSSIKELIYYKDKVKNILKVNNFVFSYCKDLTGLNIVFPHHLGYQPFHASKELIADVPELNHMDISKLIYFKVETIHSSSDWLLLPNADLVLFAHNSPFVPGLTANIVAQQPNSFDYNFHGKYKHLLFNANGIQLN